MALRLTTSMGGVLIASTLAGTGCVNIGATNFQYVEREERRFAVPSAPEVTLRTFDGSIDVESWNRREVLVVVEKHGIDRAAVASIRVDAEQTDNRIRLEVRPERFEGGFGFGDMRGARLIVTLPKDSTLRASSGDGRIEVRDLSGELVVRTDDGSIRLEDVTGPVDAQSSDGSIRVGGVLSRLRVRSGDGSVTVRAATGSRAAQDWSISTGDGSVVVELPDGFGGELDAHTGDGRISVRDLDLVSDGDRDRDRRDRGSRRDLRARLGGGGPRVRVESGDGSIVFRRF